MALTEIKTSGIADDAVTTDKLANAINTERTANTAKPSLANDGNNRVVTGDGSGGLNGEANLTFDGTICTVSGGGLIATNSSEGYVEVRDERGAAYKAKFKMAGSAPAIVNENTVTTDRTLSVTKGSNDVLIVDGDGYVTKPKQPSFVARAGANRDNVTGALTFTSCDSAWNVSSSYDTSNSRFTAPVAGWYHFGGAAGYKETDDNLNVKFMVNGAYQFEVCRIIGGSSDDSWQSHSGWAWSQIYKLAKDDYVELNTAYEMHQNGTYSNFWGYLIK